MAKIKEEVQEAQENVQDTLQEAEVVAGINITVRSDGSISIDVAPDSRKLTNSDLEGLFRNLYEQLHENRIAQQAIDLFKSRL